MGKYGRAGQATAVDIIPRMRFACWISKDKHTRSEYVVIIAFPQQQMLRDRVSLLRYYVHCHSCFHPIRCSAKTSFKRVSLNAPRSVFEEHQRTVSAP